MFENWKLWKKKGAADEVVFSRHSKAKYRTDEAILASDNPAALMDRGKQVTPDLSREGRRIAGESAAAYLSTLNPKKDKLFIVSSNLARALETAKIYADMAHANEFTVLHPDNVVSARDRGSGLEDFVRTTGGDDVRVIDALSIPAGEAPLVQEIFNSDSALFPINWDAVDPDLKARWEAAHKIIQDDDRGSWGANFNAHSAAVRERFPEFHIDNAIENYEKQFRPLIRLAEWGIRKARESDPGANIKILAFGHENYLAAALEKYFGEHDIQNCEAVHIRLNNDDSLTLERRGKRAMIER